MLFIIKKILLIKPGILGSWAKTRKLLSKQFKKYTYLIHYLYKQWSGFIYIYKTANATPVQSVRSLEEIVVGIQKGVTSTPVLVNIFKK
jgi:hypothetical protein